MANEVVELSHNAVVMNVFALVACAQVPTPLHLPDIGSIYDPFRPVCEIARTSFTLQYSTEIPCETRVQVREGDVLAVAWRPEGRKVDAWSGDDVREYSTSGPATNFHKITITNLRPGKRYFYRIYDPGARPTGSEKSWGAVPPWRREYAVSTLSDIGSKTIIRIPVKVLLILNVINVASAHDGDRHIAEKPEKLTGSDIEMIKNEFAKTALFFWVNSGMRLWIDWHFFVDDTWQRWGDEPKGVDAFYKGWPMSRAYAGVDFAGPGGGAFTILDTENPLRINMRPVYEEKPYAGQVEVAFTRKWNASSKKWELYGSGGGTYGIDSFPQGYPARSQFLGGTDLAWLACHEFHHQLESFSAFALSHREDDRIVFNHYEPRRRVLRTDGTYEETTWTTSGRHGEHWDGMAYWDRTLTDAQWLRMCFGETITVRDADGDGFPDDDARLPLDEKRFGSDPTNPMTDGQMRDLQKVMLSTWTPNPLQSSWIKPPPQYFSFDARSRDSDKDGWPDTLDPYPLFPFEPFVISMAASVDGRGLEWAKVPVGGRVELGGIDLTYKQAHDETSWYGFIHISGPWRNIDLVLDGEGLGLFSRQGVVGLKITNKGEAAEVGKLWEELKGLLQASAKQPDGSIIVEFSLPNRGEGIWFWSRGGREIGTQLTVFDWQGRAFAMYAPYRFLYARMLEPYGQPPLPPNPPEDLANVLDAVIVKPDDKRLKFQGSGWRVEDGVLKHIGDDESVAYLEIGEVTEFDLWVDILAKQDGILGAFQPKTDQMSAGVDYIVFVGGYGNTVTRFRVFGQEQGDASAMIVPGKRMTLQFSRRKRGLWLIVDGRPTMYTADPDGTSVVNRLAVLGGYGGVQQVYELRYRILR